jgi:hypothetical protein
MTRQRDSGTQRSKLGPLSRRRLKGITLQEIQDALLDDGYSADERKNWLKGVLTELEQHSASDASPEMARLIDEVKRIIDVQQQAGKPIADDVL